MVSNLKVHSKRGVSQIHMRGRGVGSVLLGTSGSASASVNGASIQTGSGISSGVLADISLKSEGVANGMKRKMKNIVF
jgi:hypothetical protein